MAQTRNSAPTRLADQLERAFRGGAWHGPAVMELLSGVDAALAQWRPGARAQGPAHTIAEGVGHLAHVMEDARRQILGEPSPAPAAGAQWGPPELPSEEAWQALCAALEESHGRLRAAVLRLEESQLDLARSGSDTTVRGLLMGVLQHTAYHAGQMALVRQLGEAAPGSRP